MGRVLVDLTDIELWNGIHGGTQRVVYGIAKYFYLQPESVSNEVVFVAFDAERRQFYETSFEPIFRRVDGGSYEVSVEEAPAVEPAAPESRSQRVKNKVRPFIPETVRRSNRARQLARHAYSFLAGHQPATEEVLITDDRRWITLAKDDTVLLLGKPWDNLDIQRTLTAKRQEVGCRVVQVVYDLIICLYPHLHHPSLVAPYTEHMKGAIAHSDLLLPISESSARDVETFSKKHGITPPPMKVIRLGDTITSFDESELQRPSDRIADTFIACVGTVEIRKNHTLLYYTYKLAAERGIDLPQLVIVGSQGWLSGDVQHLIATDPAVKDKIIMLHGVEDRGLAWVFEHCLFTVYPSMYEGWGLPVAESLVYGKACVASKASSIPEIGGELVEYFSPYSPEECLEKLRQLLDKDVRAKVEATIQASYRATSWEQTFRQVIGYIEGRI